MEAAAPSLLSLPEDDALASLEDRIRRAVELMASLREERDAAVAERDSAKKTAREAVVESQKLREELEVLRSERKQVRSRIEKLLGQMELL
jgi:FtsZ-binding cell division protein ZapB